MGVASVKNYILASSRKWALEAYFRERSELSGNWTIVTTSTDLQSATKLLKPRYIFFPHWSSIVSEEILSETECVCFHMTDVPYGRGGSPLQNLIERGHKETVLTALRMEKTLDSGPVYMKLQLPLQGTADQIFAKAAELTMKMIGDIVREEPVPDAQSGPITQFHRRNPEQSIIPDGLNIAGLYDHIRMLDAPGYPNAFIDYDHWRAHFTCADVKGDVIEARVRFEIKKKNS